MHRGREAITWRACPPKRSSTPNQPYFLLKYVKRQPNPNRIAEAGSGTGPMAIEDTLEVEITYSILEPSRFARHIYADLKEVEYPDQYILSISGSIAIE